MAERDDAVQRIKDHRRINHLVVVELSKVLDFRDTFLVELEVVLLQSQRNLFKDIVHNADDEILVIPIQSAHQDCKQVDIAVFHFDGLAEHALQDADNLETVSYRALTQPCFCLHLAPPSEASGST